MVKPWLLFLLFFCSLGAWADSVPQDSLAAPKPPELFIGGLFGPAFPTANSGEKTEPLLALEIGANIAQAQNGTTLTLGGLLSETIAVASTPTFSVRSSIVSFEFEALARHLYGTPFYLGVRAGLATEVVKISEYATGMSDHELGTSWTYAPAIGAEFKVSPEVSLGIDLSYSYLSGGTVTGLDAYSYSATRSILTLAAVKVDL
jgi:hypothetical protein